MEQCEVQHCGKIANLGGLCVFHRRKDIQGLLEYEDGLIWDICSKGHRWTLENTHIESNSKGGRRRRCKKCLALKAERKRNEEPEVRAPEPIRLADPVLRGASKLNDQAQDALTAKCKGNPAPWTDYDAAHIPTEVEAAKLCAGCPLIEPCGNAAAANREAWGVWGATVFVYGEPWDGDRSRLDEDD